jgi:hypothetical protein
MQKRRVPRNFSIKNEQPREGNKVADDIVHFPFVFILISKACGRGFPFNPAWFFGTLSG